MAEPESCRLIERSPTLRHSRPLCPFDGSSWSAVLCWGGGGRLGPTDGSVRVPGREQAPPKTNCVFPARRPSAGDAWDFLAFVTVLPRCTRPPPPTPIELGSHQDTRQALVEQWLCAAAGQQPKTSPSLRWRGLLRRGQRACAICACGTKSEQRNGSVGVKKCGQGQ